MHFSRTFLAVKWLYIVKGGFSVSLEVEEQYDKIYRYCYFKVKNVQLAEDLTQETFLKFFGQRTYITRGKPLAYLYTIAKNLSIDAYKKTELTPLEEDMGSISELDICETSLVVRQAISSLPEELQEMIMLRYANDLSIVEIGQITGVSRFAVYRKINNALSQLKPILREEDFS